MTPLDAVREAISNVAKNPLGFCGDLIGVTAIFGGGYACLIIGYGLEM